MAGRPPRANASRAIPSKPEILKFLQDQPGRVSARDVARAFGLKGTARLAIKDLLRDLAEEGAVDGSRRHAKAYLRADQIPPVGVVDIVERSTDGELLGRLAKARPDPAEARRREGRGVEPSDPPQIIIGPGRGGDAPPQVGDRVLAHLDRDDDGHVRARIIRKLGASAHRILGVFEPGAHEHRVTPVDRKTRGVLIVAPEDAMDAKAGDLVVVEMLPQRGFGPKHARVRERLVHVGTPQAISLIAIHAHGIPVDFPPEVMAEAEAARAIGLEGGRVDLTQIPLITIDPEDARDHDDAVYASADDDPANPGGFVVYVAIADVAAYVRPNSSLDREAKRRGNSVYLPDRVVPMLPERLSNDLCSLKAGVARPCLAVRMVFNAQGHKISHRFTRGLMRCHAGLSYGQVQRAVDGAPDEDAAPWLDPVLIPLFTAYRALARARDQRGPLDLDLPERKVEVGPDGQVRAIRLRERLESHRLIEEFMIQANVAAAETLEAQRRPCLYRLHEPPNPEKLEALRSFLKTLDLKIAAGEVLKPSSFNRLLAQAKGTDHADMVNEVVLRSQTQAYYGPDRLGHFGLALSAYAHFTSPIRRYADVVVHRALIHALGLGDGGARGDEDGDLEALGLMISGHERRAMAAERESIDRHLATFMADRVGATFPARISGVTRFGLFVALLESGADGLVPIASLGGEYLRHDETRHALIGARGRVVHRLGERVEVRLEEAAPITGGLRFSMMGGEKPSRVRRKEKRQSVA